MDRFHFRLGVVTALSAALLALSAAPASAQELSSRPLVVVELFTSQGCASCRPADYILAGLAERDDVLALSYHVDTCGYAGWRDPFPLPEATARHAAYAEREGRVSAYTPELIVARPTRLAGNDADVPSRAIEKIAAIAPL
jgi:hypothetical protein